MKQSISLLSIISLLIILGLSSCNKEDDNIQNLPTYMDMVTFTEQSGNNSVFTFQVSQDAPVTTLVAPVKLNTEIVKLNTRLIIGYNVPEGVNYGESTTIELVSASLIYNDTVKIESISQYPLWDVANLNLQKVWLTGQYLNLAAYTPSSTDTEIILVADKSTIGSDTVKIYAVYNNNLASGSPLTREYYASYNLSDIFKLAPDLKAISVYAPGGKVVNFNIKANLTPGN